MTYHLNQPRSVAIQRANVGVPPNPCGPQGCIPKFNPSAQGGFVDDQIDAAWQLASIAGAALGAFHGYKRNHDSIGWAIGWAILGGLLPVITIPLSIAQGFGEPEHKRSMASNKGRRKRSKRKHRKNPRGMTRAELRAIAEDALRSKDPSNKASARRIAFQAIQRADPQAGTSEHPHGVSYAHGIADLAHPLADEYVDRRKRRRGRSQ